LNNGEDPMTS